MSVTTDGDMMVTLCQDTKTGQDFAICAIVMSCDILVAPWYDNDTVPMIAMHDGSWHMWHQDVICHGMIVTPWHGVSTRHVGVGGDTWFNGNCTRYDSNTVTRCWHVTHWWRDVMVLRDLMVTLDMIVTPWHDVDTWHVRVTFNTKGKLISSLLRFTYLPSDIHSTTVPQRNSLEAFRSTSWF